MPVSLTGIGTAVPPVRISQQDAAELVAPFNALSESEGRILRELYRRSGVKQRHSVILNATEGDLSARQSFYSVPTTDLERGPTTSNRMACYAAHAGQLGTAAAQRALEAARCEPHEITHLVTVSCTGFQSPGLDVEILQALPLCTSTARTHLGFMGCHGAMNGLRVANAFAQADSKARVLMVASELCSLHHQYGWSPDRVVSNSLFADGAAALVLNQSDEGRLRYRGSGSCVLQNTLQEMTWQIGNHGFEMTLSAKVPELIRTHLGRWTDEWLASFGLTLQDVSGWAIHPGGPRILTACGEALRLDRTQWATSEGVLAEFGNMSSPTVLFVLERLLVKGITGPIVMLAFGPGLTIEATLLEVIPTNH